VVNFAKFRRQVQKNPQLAAQNCPNSAAHCGLPFVQKLSFVLFKKLQFLNTGLALSYVINTQRKF